MKYAAVFLSLICYLTLTAQNDSLKYWIELTDKSFNTYSLDDPGAFLSERALLRRARQQIPIVENDLPVTKTYIDSIASLGANILYASKWYNAVAISTNDPALIQQIGILPFVADQRKVVRLRKEPEIYAEPVQVSSKYAFDYGPSFNQIAMVNGDILHDMGLTGRGMLIAVLDGGFQNWDQLEAFQRLREEGRILATWDFVENEASVSEDHQHGTNVLSVMGGFLPGELIGTAPDASYVLLKSEDVNSEMIIEEYNWVAAAEFADSIGADIINSSLGYTTFDDSTMNHTYPDMDGNTTPVTRGADIAASKGILVVNSAGNEGTSSWQFIGAPADGDSVLAIGGVGPDSNYISFASQGPSFDGRVKPDVSAQAAGVVLINGGGQLVQANGTSFSSPIVAGMAACLWQAFPGKTNMEIFDAIVKSGSLYPAHNNFIGYGIPNFVNAHFILSNNGNTSLSSSPLAFPNPFRDDFRLHMLAGETADATIEIYDVLGRIYHSSSFYLRKGNKYAINFSTLNNAQKGVYFVRIYTENNTELLKVVKQ